MNWIFKFYIAIFIIVTGIIISTSNYQPIGFSVYEIYGLIMFFSGFSYMIGIFSMLPKQKSITVNGGCE